MSHISVYQHKIKDITAFLQIAREKGYQTREGEITVKQFGENKIDALGSVLLPGWRYEIAIKENNEILYDHFGSESNSFDQLGLLIQDYNKAEVLKAMPFDQIQGFTEEKDAEGTVTLCIEF